MKSALDGLAVVAEQCEEAGDLEAAALVDQALALLDPDSVTRTVPICEIERDLVDTYNKQIQTARNVDEAKAITLAITDQVQKSLERAIDDLGKIDTKSVQTAARVQALVMLIESCME